MKTIAAVGILSISTLLGGCAPPEEGPTDDGTPRRIVVMAPAAAEMLEALDASDRVVGIGDFVLRPASIADLPKVGAYNTPNVEQVLTLGAELLVTTSSQAGAPAHERLESLGVTVLALDTSTYDGVFRSLAEVGLAIGKEQEARELDERMRGELDAIRERAKDAPARKVLFVVGRDPIYVAGPGSHIDEMIAMVGGTNVAHDAATPYQRVSLEAVLERMPDVVVDCSDGSASAPRGRLNGSWERWDFLPAVQERRVFSVDPERLVIPGIRLPEMTMLMGRLIQPEIFGEPSDEELGPLDDPK